MSETAGPYTGCHTSKGDAPFTYGIAGPGCGLGYHGWYLFPEYTFPSIQMAEKVARMMNVAFEEGKRTRSREILTILGGTSILQVTP